MWRGDDLQVRKSVGVGNPIWDIVDFMAEVVVMPTTLGSVAAMATSDWATANNPSFQYRTLLEAQGFDFDQQDSDPTRSTCALRLSITIDRRMNYHMWNFMIMQFVLVLLGGNTQAPPPLRPECLALHAPLCPTAALPTPCQLSPGCGIHRPLAWH